MEGKDEMLALIPTKNTLSLVARYRNTPTEELTFAERKALPDTLNINPPRLPAQDMT